MKKRMQAMEQEAALAYQAEVAEGPDRIDEAHALWGLLHTIINSVLRSNPDMPHAYVSICLMSGRYEDLVT